MTLCKDLVHSWDIFNVYDVRQQKYIYNLDLIFSLSNQQVNWSAKTKYHMRKTHDTVYSHISFIK